MKVNHLYSQSDQEMLPKLHHRHANLELVSTDTMILVLQGLLIQANFITKQCEFIYIPIFDGSIVYITYFECSFDFGRGFNWWIISERFKEENRQGDTGQYS